MKRLIALTLLFAQAVSIGCGASYKRNQTATPDDLAVRRAALQDSVAFHRAVDEGRNSEALAMLWERTNRKREPSISGKVAGVAAALAGIGLAIAANDQAGRLDDAEAAGLDTDDSKGKWEVARIAGIGAAIVGLISLAMD